MMTEPRVERRRLPDDIVTLSLEQLSEWRQYLVEQKLSIETSLGIRNKTDESGNRVTGEDYWVWRGKAVCAKRYIEMDIAKVKAELHRRGQERPPKRPSYHLQMVEFLEAISDWQECPQEIAVKAEAVRGIIVEHYL